MRSIEKKILRHYKETGSGFSDLLVDTGSHVAQVIEAIKTLPVFLKDPTLITPLFSAKMILKSKVEKGYPAADTEHQLARMYQGADDVQDFLQTPREELGGATILQALEIAIRTDFEEKNQVNQAKHSTIIYN